VDTSGRSLIKLDGCSVIEILPCGFNKGTALETLAALPLFKARRPIMIGDDFGDDPAFAAAERLGGFGLAVGRPRANRSRIEFEGPANVRSWLANLADCLD